MNRNADILNELELISPLVAAVGNNNIFTVPEGYFDGLADTLLDTITAARLSAASGPQDIPEGYFDTLAGNILSKIKGTSANELMEISPLLAGLSRETPFRVPENYFDTVADEITAKLPEAVSAALNEARKVQPYAVPDRYFDELPGMILDRIKEQQGAKLVTMPQRSSRFFKYAAAAVFTGIISFGIYKAGDNKNDISNPSTTATASLSPLVEKGIAMANDEKKFEETLGNLNEEDIAKFLEKNNSESDMAVLSAGLDESSLPDQDEYITDGETLNDFIESINLNN